MRLIKTFLSVLSLFCSINAFTQNNTWLLDDDMATETNPVELNPKSIASGKNAYLRSCAACHGQNGDGKGLISSASFLTDTFQNQTDGAISYKIQTGRNQMPPFKGVIKEEEIWSVVNYLRVLANPSLAPAAKDIRLEITTHDEQQTITAFTGTADSLKQPLSEIDVHFYIQRDFGLMRFAEESNYTGKDGRVTVLFPNDIVGDSLGNVKIICKIENSFLYNDNSVKFERNWGSNLTTDDENFNKRSLWGSRSKSPVWLLLLANGIIFAVWAVIVYIVFNLVRIKKAGKIFLEE